MNRLDTELTRLFLGGLVFAQDDAQTASLVDARGRVRALVLEVLQPAGWEALSRVWQGVQAELELPAPAIAVSGSDGLQLWFSLETAIEVRRAHGFLEALRMRFLADLPAQRVRLLPDPAEPGRHAPLVPQVQASGDTWSAFVSQDLASVFSDTPWLDVEPGDEGPGGPAAPGAADQAGRVRGRTGAPGRARGRRARARGGDAVSAAGRRSARLPAAGDERRSGAVGAADRGREGVALAAAREAVSGFGQAPPKNGEDAPGRCLTPIPATDSGSGTGRRCPGLRAAWLGRSQTPPAARKRGVWLRPSPADRWQTAPPADA